MTKLTKPIPSHAKKVFQGTIFEVWQWEQKMYDGSTAIFERLRRPDSVSIIAVIDEKVMITLQEQPDTEHFLSLPGGRCEPNEKALESAQRELLEETGYVSNDWVLFKEYNPMNKVECTVSIFIARNCFFQKPAEPDNGEKIEIQWADFETFLHLSDAPLFRGKEIMEELLRARLEKEKKEALQKLMFEKNKN